LAAIANLVLADGQATPVNKTFSPADCTSQLATWTDRSSGINIGFPEVTLSLTKGQDQCKVLAKVVVPTLEVISGSDGGYTPSPKVAYQTLGKVEFVLPARSTLQNRKDVVAFVKNLLTNAVMTKITEEYERPY
jgi:hypothetical protein